jgi:hypothetical protein
VVRKGSLRGYRKLLNLGSGELQKTLVMKVQFFDHFRQTDSRQTCGVWPDILVYPSFYSSENRMTP